MLTRIQLSHFNSLFLMQLFYLPLALFLPSPAILPVRGGAAAAQTLAAEDAQVDHADADEDGRYEYYRVLKQPTHEVSQADVELDGPCFPEPMRLAVLLEQVLGEEEGVLQEIVQVYIELAIHFHSVARSIVVLLTIPAPAFVIITALVLPHILVAIGVGEYFKVGLLQFTECRTCLFIAGGIFRLFDLLLSVGLGELAVLCCDLFLSGIFPGLEAQVFQQGLLSAGEAYPHDHQHRSDAQSTEAVPALELFHEIIIEQID